MFRWTFWAGIIGYGTMALIWWAGGDIALLIAVPISFLVLWKVEPIGDFLVGLIERYYRPKRRQPLHRSREMTGWDDGPEADR